MHLAIERAISGIVSAVPFKPAWCPVVRALRPPRQIWGRLPYQGDFSLRVDTRTLLRLHSPGIPTLNTLFWRGLDSYEPETTRLWLYLSRGATSILDVGAQYGLFALLAAAVNRRATVTGFEPLRPMFDLFERNIALNGFSQARAVYAAVSDRAGEVDLHVNGEDHATASLNPVGRPSRHKVTCVTLEGFLRDSAHPLPDLLKIDVEGYEAEVLTGMVKLLPEVRPSLIVEILNDDVGARVQALLPRGYAIYQIDEKQGLVPRREIRRVDRRSRNYFLAPEERL